MKKFFLFLMIFLMAAGCSQQKSGVDSPEFNYSHTLKIANKSLKVEIAKTSQEMEKGLGDRISMDENSGMVFDFGDNKNSRPAFWMKGMKFNLDFIWISKNKIIGITPDVKAPDVNCKSLIVNCLPTYTPPSAINEVLEVNAGWAKKNKIKVGDEVRLVK